MVYRLSLKVGKTSRLKTPVEMTKNLGLFHCSQLLLPLLPVCSSRKAAAATTATAAAAAAAAAQVGCAYHLRALILGVPSFLHFHPFVLRIIVRPEKVSTVTNSYL